MTQPHVLRPSACADIIVVGAGVAGLTTALRLCGHRNVILLCKTALGSGAATAWAQGGIAAAIGGDDSPALHIADTENVGGGLNDHHVVEILARDAGPRIAELIALGASFDRQTDGTLALGREAAHSRHRILHAGGDATGREVLRALVDAVRASSIQVIEARADELLVERGRVVGLLAHRVDHQRNQIERIRLDAAAIVLATGGCGRLYRYSTNPPESLGDGLAIAARAGADLVDLEFLQFHPTALATGLDPMPLLSEALRGEGARLVDEHGRPLMDGHDERGDLAPRDVVARVIFEALTTCGSAYLDARSIQDFPFRFPTIWETTLSAGINPLHDLIPVAPAAHYHMGGISVDDHGRSSLRGLWACGETASTGAHGANRLASNSLLEALVFGARVADDILVHTARHRPRLRIITRGEHLNHPVPVENAAAIRILRNTMYEHVGIIRDAEGLRAALQIIAELEADPLTRTAPPGRLANMLLVARLITSAALLREESRGSHFRRDFPYCDARFAHRARARTAPTRRGSLA